MLAERIEAALRGPMTAPALDALARTLWGAFGAGELIEAEAERLDLLLAERRRGLTDRTAARPMAGLARLRAPRRPRSPDRQASVERRRRLAASGAVPAEHAAHFTQGQAAALAVIGHEAACGRPLCDWPMDKIAALAGVCRTTVREALRLAANLGLVHVRERRRPGARSLTNVVTIRGKRWWRWLTRGAARSQVSNPRGGGCRNPNTTYTEELRRGSTPSASIAATAMGWRDLEPSEEGQGSRLKRMEPVM